IYLFETYVHGEFHTATDYEYLIDDLSDIGFQKKDIYGALLWLKKLASYEKNMYLPVNTITDKLSTRIYTAEE
ncbi:MAG: DUF494 family protein, partial [Buchnera aphidicola]|nr:DUF494 family protein [Buchnera aphidicola]